MVSQNTAGLLRLTTFMTSVPFNQHARAVSSQKPRRLLISENARRCIQRANVRKSFVSRVFSTFLESVQRGSPFAMGPNE